MHNPQGHLPGLAGRGLLRSLYPKPSCFHFVPQTLSPKNKGLFKRAISQSGVGTCSWAIQRDPLLWAKKVTHKSCLKDYKNQKCNSLEESMARKGLGRSCAQQSWGKSLL